MIEATASILINASPEKVFDIAADGRQQLIWDAGNFKDLQQLSLGPLGKGSRFSCRVKGMGKMIYEFASYDRPHFFVHHSTSWMSFGIHRFEFRLENYKTFFSQTMQLRLRGIAILLTPFIKGKLKKQLANMNQELKAYVERA